MISLKASQATSANMATRAIKKESVKPQKRAMIKLLMIRRF